MWSPPNVATSIKPHASLNRLSYNLPEARISKSMFLGIPGAGKREDPLDVFGNNIDLEVDVIARLEVRKVGDFPGLGNDGDFEVVRSQFGDREANALHSY